MKTIHVLALLAGIAGAGAAAAFPHAVYDGSFELHGKDAYFGGFSGLEFSADGMSFIALSDAAALVVGHVVRNERGAIVAVETPAPPLRLRDETGQALVDPYADSEGLARAPDGTLFISFEREHRVAHYRWDGALLGALPVPADFADFEQNSGLEGLAIAPNGALFTLPEGIAVGMRRDQVYRFFNGTWTKPFEISEDATWRPVGADFDPEGRLYILERDFWPLVGSRSRLRRIGFDDSGIKADDVMFATPAGRHGNLEGLSIWQASDGVVHATMVSDNNFLSIMRSEFVDYTLHD